MSNEQREQQMMDASEAYAEEVGYKDEHDLCSTLNVFCAGWRAADSHPAWIPVKEELPPKVTNGGSVSIEVLVYCRGENGHEMFILDWYDYEAKNWVTADSSLVTHWMKIIPPQGKEE